MKVSHLFFLLLLILVSCNSQTGDEQEKDGIVKSYRSDGRLYTEFSYEKGKRAGISKTYHPDGKVYLEEEYVNGKRHGKTTQYYQSGKIYSETIYDSGKVHGIVKRYHKDGKLKAEVPYQFDCACIGLKEYILDGSPRPTYPEIVITTDDKRLSNATYYLNLSLTERVKKVEFFKGDLNRGCLHDKLEAIRATAEDKARIDYDLGKGGSVTDRVSIVAKIETIAGNTLVIQKSYNVDVDEFH
jgi:hypothetical protein